MSATLVLRAELDDDPLGRGYSSMSDDQLIASINEPNRPAPLRPIPSAELLGWSSAGANTAGAASDKARNQRLADAAASGSPAVAGVADAALVLLSRDGGLDVTKYADAIAVLVSGSVLVQEEADELTALATPPEISRAAELSLPVVGIGLVQNARA
tara:strand:- start:223 stop:693 length:471 start_codon:yes stop_codon:yes gene_type:complete